MIPIISDDIESMKGDKTAQAPSDRVVESEIAADADHPDPVERDLFLTARPGAAEKNHLVAGTDDAAEYFMGVNLGAAGLRMLDVPPVD